MRIQQIMLQSAELTNLTAQNVRLAGFVLICNGFWPDLHHLHVDSFSISAKII